MKSKQVIEYIRGAESVCQNLDELTSYLVDEAIALRSTDNISIIICRLK
jgi:serine/threonine protein phosphatase PrpC